MENFLKQDEYKIGAVSKITGIGTETLRAWERRYNAISPKRSDSGDRVYDNDDLSKLFLLKNLVDRRNSIGTIAHLSVNELKAKWDQSLEPAAGLSARRIASEQDHAGVLQGCNVLLVGDEFPLRVLDGMSDFSGIKVVGHVNSLEEWHQKNPKDLVHVVITERPTINEKTQELVNQLIKETGAWHAVVLYGFGSQSEINKLQGPQVSTIRSSIDVYELARLCIDRAGGDSRMMSTSSSATVFLEEAIPTRRYSYAQLESLSRYPTAIQCECPKHLTELIKSLVAFEVYSAECENRNDDDASLHSYLHATTAQSRAILEDALAHVIAHENITI